MPYHIKDLSASESTAIFRALASDSRAKILELVAERDMNINELSRALKLAQPSTNGATIQRRKTPTKSHTASACVPMKTARFATASRL